jgi:serine/threonine protein kinase HipA of HipAB toxin-antitoxin module
MYIYNKTIYMKNQPDVTTAENEAKHKKLWQTPIIEIIGHDIVQSGNTTGTEGRVFNPNSTGSGS